MYPRTPFFRFATIVGLAILMLVGAPLVLFCRAGWPAARQAHSTPQHGTLAKRSTTKLIGTPDPNVKWRITDNRFVERTTDGGATWHGQELAPEAGLLAGSAPGAKTCWVVGRGGIVYVTRDARTWKKVAAPVSADLVAISAKNARAAVVTTADGRRFETRDGGKKWKPVRESH